MLDRRVAVGVCASSRHIREALAEYRSMHTRGGEDTGGHGCNQRRWNDGGGKGCEMWEREMEEGVELPCRFQKSL